MAKKKRNLRVVDSVESVTVDSVVSDAGLHASQLDFEDEFDVLLDAESDEDFGQLELRDKWETKGEVLKNWTSQDFSNIYVRFRPNLERYAKRWLNNQSQIDEVVQDAFLYLMVTLPELDSEIGVLRFLKWKLRLLCLDVLRASGRAYINNIDDHHEALLADIPEHSSALEAADDAAVVRLALSKLTPRHREVLLATMYEEKSIAQVAQQVALSENATRQLIFRARAAFKVALIGDVDTSGMSAGAILSVAARKAAAEGRKVGAQVMVTLFVLAIAFGSIFSLGSNKPQNKVVAEKPSQTTDGQSQSNVQPGSTNSNQEDSSSVAPVVAKAVGFREPDSNTQPVSVDPTATPDAVSQQSIDQIINSGNSEDVLIFAASAKVSQFDPTNYTVQTSTSGLVANFTYSEASGITNLVFTANIDGVVYTATALNPSLAKENGHMVLRAKMSDLISPDNKVIRNKSFTFATISLEFKKNTLTGGLESAAMTITPAQN